MINICKELGIDVETRDIEQVKFVNRENAEALLKDKKRINGKTFGHLHVTNKIFVSVSLCPYYRYNWGKCKDLQKQGKLHHAFCLTALSA